MTVIQTQYYLNDDDWVQLSSEPVNADSYQNLKKRIGGNIDSPHRKVTFSNGDTMTEDCIIQGQWFRWVLEWR